MIVETGARGQGNQGLSQRVLVPAVHGVRAAAAVGVVHGRQMLSGKRGQRDLVHRGCPGSQRFEGGVNWRSRLRARPSRRELVGTTTVLKDEAPPASYVNTVVNRSLSSRAW
jgi:hypothetical protein